MCGVPYLISSDVKQSTSGIVRARSKPLAIREELENTRGRREGEGRIIL